MNILCAILFAMAIFFSMLTLVGMIKPWWVMWWCDEAYRFKVLSWYGVPALLAWAIWLLTPIC